MMENGAQYGRAIAATLALLVASGLVFALWPQLDLAAAAFFYRDGRFFSADGLRSVFYWLPATLLTGSGLLWALGKAGLVQRAPSSRAAMFLALTMALGPGLVVNVVLKEHSGRPRPVQVSEFGGKAEFRPWHAFDGACPKNCSFVSGEAAASAWTLAPALLAPAPVRSVAVAAALAFGGATGVMRMAYGGHFASDVVFAELLTLLIVLVAARLMRLPARN